MLKKSKNFVQMIVDQKNVINFIND